MLGEKINLAVVETSSFNCFSISPKYISTTDDQWHQIQNLQKNNLLWIRTEDKILFVASVYDWGMSPIKDHKTMMHKKNSMSLLSLEKCYFKQEQKTKILLVAFVYE